MKKILDSKFLFILALSLIVLIILGIGAFYLFDDSDSVFTKSGYVLNPLSAKSEKYLFNENTSYRENLSSMIVFDDVDNVETTILKESFLHYNDGGISFLKNGAILDLNSINGKDAVRFYNITNKSIINKKDDGYVIDSVNGDITLNNFMGRISDDKYIVAGSLEAKIPGNEKNIAGDYFEIVYTEEGVVNIENDEVKFQVMAEGSYIYAGNVTIDLGNKKIVKNGEDVMSITAITISGDENIEIIPKAEETDDGAGGGEGTGADNQQGGQGQGQGGAGNEGGTTGDGGADEPGQTVVDDTLKVSLKDYLVGSTSITAVFDVMNDGVNDSLTLKVINLDSGRTIDEKYNVMDEQEIRVSKLSPNTKYLLTVVNERDENKYFQKIFVTNSFGVSITKSYATSNELGYKINVDEDSDITDVRITLKRYDEEADALIDVQSYQLRNLVANIAGEHDGINFSSLDSDTIYTVVLDNFSTDSTRFNDIYNVSLTSMTLKETPTFGAMKQETGSNSFKLYLEDVVDKDNAITSYKYYIYEGNLIDDAVIGTMEPAITPIIKGNATPVEIGIGFEAEQLRNDTNYFYKVAIEYYDNEKYVERELEGSISLYIGSNPSVTITKNDNQITYNQIGATILLTDNSCLMTMPGRTGCDGTSTVQIDVKKRDINGETTLPGYPLTDVAFDVNGSIIKKDLIVDNLEPGVTYVIYVSGEVNGRYQLLDRGEIYENEISTKYLANFDAVWEDADSTVTNAINTSVKLDGIERSNAMTPADTASVIRKVIIRLYDGEYSGNLQNQRLIASESFVNTDEFNIKEKFYDEAFTITEAIFSQIGDADTLASYNDSGKLSEAYTLSIEGFYDVSESRAVGITSGTAQHTYVINPDLYTEIEEPELVIREIYKSRIDNFSNLLTNGETVVGYNLQARYDREGFEQVNRTINNINIYVYNDHGSRVQFYVMRNDELTLVDKITSSLGNSGSYEDNIYLASGTPYGTSDTIMARGNKYYIGFEITYTDANGVNGVHPSNDNRHVPASYGCYPDEEGRTAEKASAKINYLYIAETTTDNKLTYNYEIKDIDNSLYKTGDNYNLNYRIGEGSEQSLALTEVEDDVKTFRGSVTINELNNGDIYTLYYKKNILKTGSLEADVIDYTIGNNGRLFDGYHNALDNTYNFNYEVINNPRQDNKVTLKVLATEEMLNRTFGYRVKFTDTKGHELSREVWQLVKCDDALEGEINRCIQVEYIDLRDAGMKSEGSNINTITVSLQAIYDNGLTGYNYADKVGEGKQYPYMIMQDDSTSEEVGSYLIINNRVLMKSNPRYPKGYYTYDISNGYFNYNSQYNTSDKVNNIPVSLGAQGYYISLGSLNPKMISVDTLSTENAQFSFSSITPMIKQDNVIGLINGAKIDMVLSGADINDICDESAGNTCINNQNGTKYLYIEVWDDEANVGDSNSMALPTIKVPIDKSNVNKTYTVDITNLLHGSTYYYNIYAYLNNNGNKAYTQVFDAIEKNEAVTYTFDSKQLSEIFSNSFTVTYRNNPEGDYNDKLLDMKFSLIPYDEELDIPYDYNITYVLCEVDAECDLDDDTTYIFKKNVEHIADSVVDTIDISDMDLVFGKNYYMYMYVTYNVTGGTNTVPFYEDTGIATTFLKELRRPEFVVTRKASYIDNTYVIDFTVNASDIDKVLEDGKYHVELLDSNGDVVGTLMVKEDDNTYRTIGSSGYEEYEFSLADVVNQSLRISDLTADTKYTLKVVGNAYMNNASLDDPNVTIVSGPAGDGYKVWTTNAYGVAFGNEVTYGATKTSIIVYYPGGSNFENVREVIYEIENIDTKKHYYGSYTIGENDKYFEFSTTYDRWMFEIDPEDMDNNVGEIFTVTTSYMVYDEVTGMNQPVDYTTYSSLSSRFPYVE